MIGVLTWFRTMVSGKLQGMITLSNNQVGQKGTNSSWRRHWKTFHIELVVASISLAQITAVGEQNVVVSFVVATSVPVNEEFRGLVGGCNCIPQMNAY
jgi:hypothetical protein